MEEKRLDRFWVTLLGKIWRAFVGCYVYRNSIQSIPDNTWTALSFNTVISNKGSVWGIGVPTRLTAPHDGWYAIGGGWRRDAAQNVNGGYHSVAVKLNGATYVAITDNYVPAGVTARVHVAVDAVYLTQGQFAEIMAYHNDGAARNATAGSATIPANICGYMRGPL